MYSHDARPADLLPDFDPRTVAQAAAEGRRLIFRASGLIVEVEITGTGGARRLTGQLAPRQSALVDVRGVIAVETDELGQFSADALPPGQLSLRCRLGADLGQPQVTTGWITLRSQ